MRGNYKLHLSAGSGSCGAVEAERRRASDVPKAAPVALD